MGIPQEARLFLLFVSEMLQVNFELFFLSLLGVLFSICAILLKPRKRVSRKYLVQLNSLTGICVSSYALFVEQRLRDNPFYQPTCNTRGSSCAKVRVCVKI